MVVQQKLVSSRVRLFDLRHACSEVIVGDVVEEVFVDLSIISKQKLAFSSVTQHVWGKNHSYLCNPCPQKRPNQILEPFQLGLDDNQGEIGLGIHVARHLLHSFYLLLDLVVDALEQPVGGPGKQFGCRALGDPGARQVLQVARFLRDLVRDGIDFAEDVINVHCGLWIGSGLQ